jgi:hypothetical protein
MNPKLKFSYFIFLLLSYLFLSSHTVTGQVSKAMSYQKKGEYDMAMQYAREAYDKRKNAFNTVNLYDLHLIYYWNAY